MKASRFQKWKIHCFALFFCLSFISGCQREEGGVMFSQAIQLWEEEKYDESIQNFIALTKAFPEHELVDDALFWIANIYDQYLNEPKQAIRFYRSLNKSFESSPHYYKSMLKLALVYERQGDDDKRRAIRIYEKLQKLTPVTEEGQWVDNQYRLAKMHFELKQYEKCRIELKNLILKYPNSNFVAKAYYLIGYAYYVEGNLRMAEITFLETDKKFNYSRESLSSAISLADVYEELGQIRPAIAVYKKIINRLDSKEEIYSSFRGRVERLESRLKKTRN